MMARRRAKSDSESALPDHIAGRRIAADEIVVLRIAGERTAERRRAAPHDLGIVRDIAPAAGGAEIRRRRGAVPAALVDPAADHLVITISLARPHPQILALAARALRLDGMFEAMLAGEGRG